MLAGAGRCLGASGLAAKGHLWPRPAGVGEHQASPPSQDGSLLAEKHKANVSSGLLGIFSAKSPISLERNPRLPGREEVEAGGRVAAVQLLPLTRCSRFLLAVTPASQQKGSGKAAMGVRMLFFIFFFFSSLPSSPTGPYRKASQASWPSNHSPSWWPACGCPLDHHYPSCNQLGADRLPALTPSFFFPPKRYFFHMHPSPSGRCWWPPQAFCTLSGLATAKREPRPASVVCSLPTHAAAALVTPTSWGRAVAGATVAVGQAWW